MKKTALALLLVSSYSMVAYAADPVAAGTTRIGTHPSYGTNYNAFWRNGADYALLTNGINTYLNAPTVDGELRFRVTNDTYAVMDRRAFSFFTPISASSDIDVYGSLNAWTGLLATPLDGDSWGASIGGSNYGASVSGDILALQVSGPMTASAKVTFNDTLTVQNAITLNQNKAYKPGGGSWFALSDARVKQDIVDFDDGLAAIEQVRSVRFRYNGLGGTTASDQTYVGVIAQELEQTAPYMVSSSKRALHEGDVQPTDVKEVDPSAFTYLLINAVQELSAQNKAMKSLVCKDHPKSDLCKNEVVAPRRVSRFAKH